MSPAALEALDCYLALCGALCPLAVLAIVLLFVELREREDERRDANGRAEAAQLERDALVTEVTLLTRHLDHARRLNLSYLKGASGCKDTLTN